MVARIARVDGDERQVAQVLAALQPERFGAVGLGHRVVGEIVRNPVLVDRDQRYRPWGRRVANTAQDARARQAQPGAGPGLLGLHQFAVLGPVGGAFGHLPFGVGALVDGKDAPAFGGLAEHAHDLARIGADPADEPRLVVDVAAPHRRYPRQDPVAFAQRRIGGARDDENHRLHPLAMPLQRPREEIAVRTRPGHLKHAHRWQAVGVAIGLLALLQMAFGFELLQDALEVDAVGALQPERLGDIALGGLRWVFRNPVENFGFFGYPAHDAELACSGGRVMAKLRALSTSRRGE